MYSINSPAGLLSTIPVHLGRYPSNSVVALTIEGKRTGATLRIDKPAVMDEAWMSTFVSYLEKAPCDQVVLAVYSSGHQELRDPHYEAEVSALADYITTRLPVSVMLAALVTPDYWMDYSDGEMHPSLELEATAFVAEVFANGDHDKNVHTIPDALPDAEFRSEVEVRSFLTGEFEQERLFALWNSLLASGRMPDREESIRLTAGFMGGEIRDGMLVRTFAEDVDVSEYAAALLGTLPGFDRGRFEAVLALIKHLLTLDAPVVHRASLLSGLGWLHWHAGRGSHATDCFDAGLALDPGHRLCTLLHQFVSSGKLSPVASTKSNWIN